MELNNTTKTQVVEAIKADRKKYSSDSKHAHALGLSSSVYNALKQGNTEKQVSDAGWIRLARALNISRGWQIAQTPTYIYIQEQLRMCQVGHLSKILCDLPNIGKTTAAEDYARHHKEAVYIDCSQYKTKMRLIKAIAHGFGLSTNGQYTEVYDRLCRELEGMSNPLIILDEAGDLQNEAFLELKGLWNAAKDGCGWYMMGADGLEAKISRAIANKKQGYVEMLSRYNDEFDKATEQAGADVSTYLRAQLHIVAQANAPQGCDIRQLVERSRGSLRKLRHEIEKENQLERQTN